MNKSDQSPFYKRLSLNLISLALICVALIYGKPLLLPVAFAVLFANLLLPVVNFLGRKGTNRVISILAPLVLSIIVGCTVVFLLSSQISKFFEDVPALKEKSTELVNSFQTWISEHINIGIRKQNQYIQDTKENLKEQAPEIVGFTVASLMGLISYFVLIPILTFLILYYKSTIKQFFISIFTNGSQTQVKEVLDESTSVAQSYMIGLLIETTIVFTLNVIGFLILGIKYAVFLALLAAILNLIPFVGILVANVMAMVVTLISSDNIGDVIWVGVILGLVQFFDNNVGMPLIVGTKVRINALATLLGVLLGGLLCGVPGMFLAIPGLAFLKVMFDKVPDLQPWGQLLSDESESSGKSGWKLFGKKKEVSK
jgi:predicted PurR-regulated permease PerM